MKVQFLIVANDENVSDKNIFGHGMEFEIPSVPGTGDLVTVSHPDQEGQAWFIVRRTIWSLSHPGAAVPYRAEKHPVGAAAKAILECEFAVGPYQFEEHKDG